VTAARREHIAPNVASCTRPASSLPLLLGLLIYDAKFLIGNSISAGVCERVRALVRAPQEKEIMNGGGDKNRSSCMISAQ